MLYTRRESHPCTCLHGARPFDCTTGLLESLLHNACRDSLLVLVSTVLDLLIMPLLLVCSHRFGTIYFGFRFSILFCLMLCENPESMRFSD
ncbi:hypothetical protein O6P43_033697 [Quillaja saponaria]|uniref:Uncharacterized protein n=1 Tax=Quillaja saponaria TaxID=32244 RepID=A0AAD7KQQ8_QUISA|nr:hypothetical protein O6P43_033697 [Quillaja saponaria]